MTNETGWLAPFIGGDDEADWLYDLIETRLAHWQHTEPEMVRVASPRTIAFFTVDRVREELSRVVEGRVSESRPSTAPATALHAHRYKSGECIIADCEAIYDKDRWYVPDWNQTEDPTVSAPSTALETADERPCRVCGQGPKGWNHNKLGAHEWEPVSPPSPGDTGWRSSYAVGEVPDDGSILLERSATARGWRRGNHHDDANLECMVEWHRPDGSGWVDVPLAVEEAIRAEAERPWVEDHDAWTPYITRIREENRRLQTALDEVRGTLSRSERDLLRAMGQRDRAQEDRDKYRTALEEGDDDDALDAALDAFIGGPGEGLSRGLSDALRSAIRAYITTIDTRRAAHEDTNG